MTKHAECEIVRRSVGERDWHAPVVRELDSYNTGSRELLLQLIMMDPWSRSEDQAAGLLNEILDLPHYGELRAHYR